MLLEPNAPGQLCADCQVIVDELSGAEIAWLVLSAATTSFGYSAARRPCGSPPVMGDLAIPNLLGGPGGRFSVAKAPSWAPLSENYRTTSGFGVARSGPLRAIARSRARSPSTLAPAELEREAVGSAARPHQRRPCGAARGAHGPARVR